MKGGREGAVGSSSEVGRGGRREGRRDIAVNLLPKIFLEQEIILLKPVDQVCPIFWLESLHAICILRTWSHANLEVQTGRRSAFRLVLLTHYIILD